MFFFKQKTAYEMRISDWSSDVCASDLMTHCEGAKVVQQFGEAADGFLCPTQWAETLSYSDKYFGSAAEYDKLFKETYDGYTTVPYQAAQASAAVIVYKEAFEKANSFDKIGRAHV